MPSSSKKQHNFMSAIANNPAFAKKVGIPQSVGKDFTTADKGRKFAKGGDMATMNPGFMAMMAKKKGMHEMPDGKMMKDSAMKKMNMGGMAEGGMADMKQDKAMMQKAVNKHEGRLHKGATMTKLATGGSFRASANGIAQQGKTKGMMVKMANGGFVRAADGVAQRGKTKATQIKMNRGGMSC